MKIGIISINMYPKKMNYACPLHSYAFQNFLERNGFDATIIDYVPTYGEGFDLKHPTNWFTQKLKTCTDELKRKELQESYDKFNKVYKEREIRADKFQNFTNKYYKQTNTTYTADMLEIVDPGFDCYICATDVIWKYEPNHGYERSYFLYSSCMENKWKIAYAGSRNSMNFGKNHKAEFKQYIQDLDYISVREESLKKYIKNHCNRKDITCVLDPVFLQEKEFYENILEEPKEKDYILLYYVIKDAKETISQAVAYAKKHNLKIIEMSDDTESRIDKDAGVEVLFKYEAGIEEWLGYIKNADAIFTNSFHGTCLSIIFEKEFYAGYRNGDKIQNILEKAGLMYRYFGTNENPDYIDDMKKIDYSEVREKLNFEKEQSSNFIISTLKEIKDKKKKNKTYDKFKKKIKYNLYYYSGIVDNVKENVTTKQLKKGELVHLSSGAMEYRPYKMTGKNNGKRKFEKNFYTSENYDFVGYNIRFRIENSMFWYLEDGTFKNLKEYDEKKDTPIKLFKEKDKIPYIPVNSIKTMVAVSVWKKK